METYEEGFSGRKTAEVVGISYRQLDYWARTDLIRPSLSDASGSGSRRSYSYNDLLELKTIKKLLDAWKDKKRDERWLRERGAQFANADALVISDAAYTIGWAIVLIGAVAWAAHRAHRGLFKASRQKPESLGFP